MSDSFDLTRLPPRALRQVAKAIQSGDEKYERWDWLDKDGSDDVAAALRHINRWLDGEDDDPETLVSGLAHAAARLLYVLEREAYQRPQGDWRRPALLGGIRRGKAGVNFCHKCGLPWTSHGDGPTRHHDPVCPDLY